MRKLTECKNAPSEAWLTMEKGAAKRFMGEPSESLRSLLIKPKFDLDIAYYSAGRISIPNQALM